MKSEDLSSTYVQYEIYNPKNFSQLDLKDCKDMINVFPYNNVSPYLRDKGELNIFDVFLGIKVALGFKYIF